MSIVRHNTQGVELGPNSYVRCTTCGKEVQGISRETSREYAICLHHRDTFTKGDIMPAVPKPSQAGEIMKEKKRSHHKKANTKPKAAKKPKAERKKSEGAVSHYAELTELAKAADGLTPDEIRAECEKRGLSTKTGGNYVCYLKRDGLVKKAAKDKEAA